MSFIHSFIRMLNDGNAHDAVGVAKTLGISHSELWRVINELQYVGVRIRAEDGKGLALLEPLELLQESEIKKYLSPPIPAITIFERIPSTNAYLEAQSFSDVAHICLAEQQTQGRGRLQREWYSPFAQNIYFSLSYPFKNALNKLQGLSLVVSLAVIQTLQACRLPNSLFVKWPNDVMYADKKISGNLISLQAHAETTRAIIGIGVNVNMTNDDKNINQAWTSIKAITGETVDRNWLCSVLINNLSSYLEKFSQCGLSVFIDEWQSVDRLNGKKISVQSVDKKYTGIVRGINSQGNLLLELSDGKLVAFSSGDTTLASRHF